MQTRRLFVRAATATGLLALASWAAPAAAAAALACISGWTTGDWDLPNGAGSGYVVGKLIESPSNVGKYKLEAKLIATPTTCLACIQGTIYGYLDDGFGPSPDYIVKGQYSGTSLNGQGTFSCLVYNLNGTGPVGKIAGKFADAPWPGGVGKYKGEWKLCP